MMGLRYKIYMYILHVYTCQKTRHFCHNWRKKKQKAYHTVTLCNCSIEVRVQTCCICDRRRRSLELCKLTFTHVHREWGFYYVSGVCERWRVAHCRRGSGRRKDGVTGTECSHSKLGLHCQLRGGGDWLAVQLSH